MHINTPEQQEAILVALAARNLLEKWLAGENITDTIDNASPNVEEIIIEAAIDLQDIEMQKEWINIIRGDGSDKRRDILADKCVKKTQEINESLRWEK